MKLYEKYLSEAKTKLVFSSKKMAYDAFDKLITQNIQSTIVPTDKTISIDNKYVSKILPMMKKFKFKVVQEDREKYLSSEIMKMKKGSKMDLINKYLGEARIEKTFLSKDVINILKRVKGWNYDNDLQPGTIYFFYVAGGKRIPEGGRWVQIQIPYFDYLEKEGEYVDAWISHYVGDEMVNNYSGQRQRIYNLKGLENVLKREKNLVDKLAKMD